ncbi:TULIP family P47-like protein [Xenorhabdus bovienii]|uniref:TULIP family P47-like protein n=1 Tax=Xenorhabdus bovienii TaxID=40576 RepID=UPI0023B2709E|nr:TULIP family P47-like protein [Xenorhabdus bovienii]MDE9553223.1 TULIP family P47-like protein [Xenorhabdus bovienii]
MADISTSGWDVVNATDIETLNKIINKNNNYPDNFEQKIKIVGSDFKITGKWGEWVVINEASGKDIVMQCFIKSGHATFEGTDYCLNSNNNTQLSSVNIQISLEGIETDPEKWFGDDNTSSITDKTQCHELVISKNENIIITQTNFTNKELYSEDLTYLIESAFRVWFNDNSESFNQIFSVVLIGLKANKDDFQWLKPSVYSYSANSSIDKKTTAFGALTLVDGKTEIGDLQQTVDISALQLVKSFGANAALIVSKTMFVKHILLESAVELIKETTIDDFEISESGISISNKNEVVWQDFDGPDNEKMSPIIPKGNFILTLQSDYIHISIVGAHYRPRAGVTVYMSIEQNFNYKVEKNKNGEPVFVPDEKNLGNATISCSVKMDNWLNWLELVTGIITSIASIIALGTGLAGVIADAAQETVAELEEEQTVRFVFNIFNHSIELEESSFIAGIAKDILNGVESNPTIFNVVKIASKVTAVTTGAILSSVILSDAIYNSIFKDVPSFQAFSDNFIGAVKWPGIENIELKSATLADSFVIGLKLD